MSHQFLVIKIQKIYLDNNNPRHDPIDNEASVIAHLVAHEQVKALAEDVVLQGMMNPLDRFAVIPHPTAKGAYVVAEGNRRLCALKLLHDPDKSPNELTRKLFVKMARQLKNKIEDVDAVVFSNMPDASHWLSLRHEGPMDGVGTKSWNARGKERFSSSLGSAKNPNVQAALLLQYALHKKFIDKEMHDGISLTTITRFLSNPEFRAMLGLTNATSLEIKVPQEEFDRAAIQFLCDAYSGKSGVTSRTNKADRVTYADHLKKKKIAPTNLLDIPITLSPGAGAVRSLDSAATARQTRNNRNPDTRKSVIPSDYKVHIRDTTLKRVFDELRSIGSDDYPFAAAYLVRATTEHIAKLYCKKFGLGDDAELHKLIDRCQKHLDPQESDRKLKPLRKMAAERHSRWSPDSLGSWVHGSTIPNRAELNRFWDEHEYGLNLLLTRL